LGIIKRNPMRSRTVKIEYKSRKQKTERYLTLRSAGALLSVLSGRDHLIVRMLIQLGLRSEELFALRKDDVGPDFIRVDELLRKAKSRKPRRRNPR
jgi:integrase